jgi:hypothetical protein
MEAVIFFKKELLPSQLQIKNINETSAIAVGVAPPGNHRGICHGPAPGRPREGAAPVSGQNSLPELSVPVSNISIYGNSQQRRSFWPGVFSPATEGADAIQAAPSRRAAWTHFRVRLAPDDLRPFPGARARLSSASRVLQALATKKRKSSSFLKKRTKKLLQIRAAS